MDAQRLFDAFPDIFFDSLKEQIFIGIMPSETVETLLKPILEEYDKIMPQLSFKLQNDIKEIFKVYPEVAEEYGIDKQTIPVISRLKDTLTHSQ
ncbi:MAG: hypothetical protein GY749_15660 [Desulfobacteraceae bacterium]|nr:hypothetical protein [Desulfobacteraceae bacterium]